MPEWEKALPGPKSALEARRIVGIDGFGGKSRSSANRVFGLPGRGPPRSSDSSHSDLVGPGGSRGRLLRRWEARAAAGLRARQRDGGVATDWYRAGGDAAVRITHVAPRSSWGTFLVKATTEGSVWTSWASPCATRSRGFWASGW